MKPKFRTMTSSHALSTLTSMSRIASNPAPQSQSLNFMTAPDIETGHAESIQQPAPTQQPSYDTTIHRNPFLLRTNLDFPVHFKLPFFKSNKTNENSHSDSSTSEHHEAPRPINPRLTKPSGIHTRVWSDEESRRLCSQEDDHSVADTPSSSDPHGVHIETMFTRETYKADEQQR